MVNRRWFCVSILFHFRFIAVCLCGVHSQDVLSSGGVRDPEVGLWVIW